MVKFRKVTWTDFQPGDILYYQLLEDKEFANGPVTVVDPVAGIIQNSSGVKLKALNWRVQLLKLDLVSMLVDCD